MVRVWGVLLSFVVFGTALLSGQNSGSNNLFSRREHLYSAPVAKSELPDSPSYQPLTPREKFDGFYKEAKSPYVLFGSLVTSVTWQWGNRPPFGTGDVALAKGLGAAVAQRETSLFLSRYLIPTAFHQDPRYFPAPEDRSKFYRASYAASRVLLTRSDSGGQTWNGSYILGNLASAGISNLYISERDAGTIFTDFAVGMGTDAGYNIVREFWPSMRKHVPGGKNLKRLCDLVVGAPKPAASEEPQHH